MDPGELDRLLAATVDAAGRLLAEHGQFWPFAVALTDDGELVSPSVDPGEPQPDVARLVELLRSTLRADRDRLRAAAVCTDVRVSAQGAARDALRVELEPRSGQPVVVVVPYGPGPVFDAPVGAQDARRIWS